MTSFFYVKMSLFRNTTSVMIEQREQTIQPFGMSNRKHDDDDENCEDDDGYIYDGVLFHKS